MAGSEETIEIGGKAIQLFTGGAGAPLLYLHGAGVYWWMPAHELLAARHRVHAPVHPGFGASEGYEEIEGIDDLVFHTLDVMDALGLERADVVGLSLGGWLAAELALRHPGRVNRLVLVDAAGTRVRRARVGGGAPVRARRAAARAARGRAAWTRGRRAAAVEPGRTLPQAHEPARPDQGAHPGDLGRAGPGAAAAARSGLPARNPRRAAPDPGRLRPPAALRAARGLRASRARLPADLRPEETPSCNSSAS